MSKNATAHPVSVVIRSARTVVGFALFLAAMSGTAQAAILPEIDAGSMTSGLALLAGGMLLLSGRSSKK